MTDFTTSASLPGNCSSLLRFHASASQLLRQTSQLLFKAEALLADKKIKSIAIRGRLYRFFTKIQINPETLNTAAMILKESRINNIVTIRIDVLHQYDQYTFNHSLRVAELAAQLAINMSCENKLINTIYIAALMHDIGKIYLPKNILNKPGLLTHEERMIVQSHSILGYLFLNQFTVFDHVKDIVLHHHERYDGNGYPSGLKKDRIPLGSRVIAVADTYDALTSERIYHKAVFYKDALLEIHHHEYDMFDPVVVDHLTRMTG